MSASTGPMSALLMIPTSADQEPDDPGPEAPRRGRGVRTELPFRYRWLMNVKNHSDFNLRRDLEGGAERVRGGNQAG